MALLLAIPVEWTGGERWHSGTEGDTGVRQTAAWSTQRRPGTQESGDVTGEPADPVDAAEALLARIAAGDRQALAALYAREGTALLHYLLQFTPDRGLAEELLQDTFVAVWRNAGSFEGRSRARAWLFGIARRRACKRLRRRDPPSTRLDQLDELLARDPEPEAALLAEQAREALLDAIGRLNAIHREVLLLTFVHELSNAEIADILDVPLGTVKSRLSHAKRAVRALLASGEEAGH
jgi:RNA polymerase sigma-70 factor (ECF subfamily)